MEYPPFGINSRGEKIRDVSGVTVRANVDYLEEVVSRTGGPKAGRQAVEELCQKLNERQRDVAHHVTPKFLQNVWNSYSYEFVCYLGELCKQVSKDPLFQFHVGQEKFISPIIQTLGRPFPVHQIYKMFSHFGEKFAKGSIHFEAGAITDRSAVLRMKFTDHVYQQFGPYRKACAELICQSSKAGLAAVPQQVHSLQPATVIDRTCIADGAEYCEWEFRWVPKDHPSFVGPVAASLGWLAAFAYMRLRNPAAGLAEAAIIALIPAAAAWLANEWWRLTEGIKVRERLIQEQLEFVDARHEELREAYLVQEQVTVELKRKVGQLTLLHQTGVFVSSTLDREVLLQTALETIHSNLHYDRVMIAFYDPIRQVSYDARSIGTPAEVAAFARSLETPVTDPNSIEGRVQIGGTPILVKDIREVWDHLHPFTQQLAAFTRAQSFISVPLKVKDRVIGTLTVDRLQEHALNEEDLDIMVTVANQLAIALDHAEAYRQIESLNISLESKVRERTGALEEVNRELQIANEKLRELDQLKSAFVSTVSHELRTPMTSIKAYVENMLDGLVGELTEKQIAYLTRVNHNTERLTRMINDLLDLSRIEAGRIDMYVTPVSIPDLVSEVVESLQRIAQEKSVALSMQHQGDLPTIQGDRDKLHQVLSNLVHNAIKFTPSGGQVIVKSDRPDANSVRMCVEDTGRGLAPREAERVFEKFYRADSTPSETRGAGLGLAIARSLVELHGGRIWVERREGNGSRFYVTLPTGPRET